jgi:hypothetical protein
MKNILVLILLLATSEILFGQYMNHKRQEVIAFYDTSSYWNKADSSNEKVCYVASSISIIKNLSHCFYFDKKDECIKYTITGIDYRISSDTITDFDNDVNFIKYKNGYIDKFYPNQFLKVTREKGAEIYTFTELKK